MANRIIVSTVITLALAFSPTLSLATKNVTKNVKKKSSSKAVSTVRHKGKARKKIAYHHHRHHEYRGEVVQSSVVPYSSYRSTSSSVAETPPLIKVTPQRDGAFLLQPLEPKKPLHTSSQPSSKAVDLGKDISFLTDMPKYNSFTPWDFSDLILTQAKSYRGTPYCRGGSLQTGYATDCSGFVQYIYHGFKINLPRSSAEQAQVGKVVTREMDFSKMLPGDLLFFRRGGHVGHAGIYLGEGKMIHESNPRTGVTVTDLREPYYENTFVVAKRVFEVRYPN
jgi:cell wall-associated NlpC family hydrolase